MAKKTIKKTAKKVVKKVLDKTDLDEKIVAEYNKNKPMYDTILEYINSYGQYVLAVGAGCMFGVNNWLALVLLCVTAGWAYFTACNCKPCRCGNNTNCCS